MTLSDIRYPIPQLQIFFMQLFNIKLARTCMNIFAIYMLLNLP